MSDKTYQFPRPVPPRPPTARQHCRHYHYRIPRPFSSDVGPHCSAGVDLSAPGASGMCMPPPFKDGCSRRSEWTEEERAATEEWSREHMARMRLIMEQIPRDAYEGSFPCPACGTGMVSFARARSNRHLHAGCSTPLCFRILQ